MKVPHRGATVINPLVPSKELETTTVTFDENVYHRRVRVLDRAGQTLVSEACRTFGISRTTYYPWAARAGPYASERSCPRAGAPRRRLTHCPPETVDRAGRGHRPAHPWRPPPARAPGRTPRVLPTSGVQRGGFSGLVPAGTPSSLDRPLRRPHQAWCGTPVCRLPSSRRRTGSQDRSPSRRSPSTAHVRLPTASHLGHRHDRAVLVTRIVACLRNGTPYEIRVVDGRVVTSAEARAIVSDRYWIPLENQSGTTLDLQKAPAWTTRLAGQERSSHSAPRRRSSR